jgi:sulfoxide reductase catalytic subunit YedY
MLIRRRRGWELPDRLATSETLARLGRRALLGAATAAAAAPLVAPRPARAQFSFLFGGGKPAAPAKPLAPLTAPRNDRFSPGRAITPEKDATNYNNYYEFGTSKYVTDAAQALVTDPWSIELTGMVEKPKKIGLEDLLKQVTLEERVYRHRCVEAWAMTVPWVGFPLASLVKLAAPTASATYLKFTTLADAKTMPGLSQSWYPWPYTEGVTMAEAMNELAFLSVGMYGKVIPPQDGAPIRVTLPWKYGFKSAKSIVKVEFTDKRPSTFWEALQESEYGFWANVNPAVPHPRWSQAQERLLGSGEMVPTQIWNGYGEFVASMYDGLKNERLFA